jgi:hypothetical protein
VQRLSVSAATGAPHLAPSSRVRGRSAAIEKLGRRRIIEYSRCVTRQAFASA